MEATINGVRCSWTICFEPFLRTYHIPTSSIDDGSFSIERLKASKSLLAAYSSKLEKESSVSTVSGLMTILLVDFDVVDEDADLFCSGPLHIL